MDELSQKVKEEKLHCQNLEQELSNANNVIDSLHEQIKHLENIVTTEQERNKQNSVSELFSSSKLRQLKAVILSKHLDQ